MGEADFGLPTWRPTKGDDVFDAEYRKRTRGGVVDLMDVDLETPEGALLAQEMVRRQVNEAVKRRNTLETTITDGLEAKFGNAPIDTNVAGGKQSRAEYRYDLMSPEALHRLAHVLWYGAKRYGDNNWMLITTRDHINHALFHLFAYLNEDTGEDHLAHAFTRVMMAIDLATSDVDTLPPDPDNPVFALSTIETAIRDALGENAAHIITGRLRSARKAEQ